MLGMRYKRQTRREREAVAEKKDVEYYIPYIACLAKKKTPFQRIEIYKSIPYGKIMLINGNIQAAETDEHQFHEALTHPALLAHPNPRQILILGLGPAAVAREVLRYSAIQTVIGVDIDQTMIDLAQKYLPEWSCGAFNDKRLKAVFMDAKAYIEQPGPLFDVIIMNLPDPQPGSPLAKVYMREFYKKLKERLAPGGIFVTQAHAFFPQGDNARLKKVQKGIASIFKHTQLYGCWIASFHALQVMIIASQEPLRWNNIDTGLEERGITLQFYSHTTHQQMFSSIPGYV